MELGQTAPLYLHVIWESTSRKSYSRNQRRRDFQRLNARNTLACATTTYSHFRAMAAGRRRGLVRGTFSLGLKIQLGEGIGIIDTLVSQGNMGTDWTVKVREKKKLESQHSNKSRVPQRQPQGHDGDIQVSFFNHVQLSMAFVSIPIADFELWPLLMW